MSLVYICAKIGAVVVYPTSKQFLCKDRLKTSHPKGKKKKAYLTSLDFLTIASAMLSKICLASIPFSFC